MRQWSWTRSAMTVQTALVPAERCEITGYLRLTFLTWRRSTLGDAKLTQEI